VAVPIAHDQAHRIACCVRAGLAVRAELAAPAIESAALGLLARQPASTDAARFGQPRVRNRMEEVLDALTALLAGGPA